MLNYQDPLDATFQALADTSRRAMLAQLSRGPASVSDLARPLAMTLPAVMQHLTVLEQAGLVHSEKIGRVRTCRMVPSSLSQAEQWISQRRAEWEGHFDRLGEYLATMKKEAASDGVNADLNLTHFGRNRRSKSDPPGPVWPHARTGACDPVCYTCTARLAA